MPQLPNAMTDVAKAAYKVGSLAARHGRYNTLISTSAPGAPMKIDLIYRMRPFGADDLKYEPDLDALADISLGLGESC